MGGSNFIYLPTWAKATAIFVLVATLLAAIFIALKYVGEAKYPDWILISMSVAQISASGLAASLILFFSQRSIDIGGLVHRSDVYLTSEVPDGVKRLESLGRAHEGKLADVTMRVVHAKGSYGAIYIGAIDKMKFRFRVTLNVNSLTALFYISENVLEQKEPIETLFEDFYRVAKRGGYSVDIQEEVEEFDKQNSLNIYAYKDFGEGFLHDTEKRLASVQQVAHMLRALCLQATRSELKIAFASAPGRKLPFGR